MVSSVCLLVQGPLHKATLANVLRNLSSVDQCVVSTWNTNDGGQMEILQDLLRLQKESEKISIIVRALDRNRIPHLDRGGLQFMSIKNGLDAVRTLQVVKCRSDEEYDLEEFLKEVLRNPHRTLFSNFIVRDWLYHPFHISDHLFASPTQVLSRAIEQMASRTSDELEALLSKHSKTPEVVLGYHLFEAHELRDRPLLANARWSFNRFSKHFDLFDLGALAYYSVNANQAGVNSLRDIRALRSLRSVEGYRLNFHHYSTTRQLRPAPLRHLYTRHLEPIVRAIALKCPQVFR
jgi:hypothetical protein